MLTSPFFRRLFLPYLQLICAATAGVGVFAARTVHATYVDRQTAALRSNLRLVAADLAPRLATGGEPSAIDARVKQMGAAIGNRITIMRDDGVVIADSDADPASMENHRQRPEFAAAIHRGEGDEQRPSATVHTDLLYLSRAVEDLDGNPVKGPAGQNY